MVVIYSVDILETIKLYALNGWILWYVKYILNKSIKKEKEKVKYIYDILECVTFKLRADPNQVEAKKAIVSSAIQYAFWEVTPNPDKLHPILSPKHPCRFR